MCPDQKVDWFKDNDFTRDEIRRLETSVIAHWVENYGSDIIVSEGVNTEQTAKVQVLQFC